MRVAYSAIRFPPARGGVETYVEGMALATVARGHDVVVVTSNLDQHLPSMRRTMTPDALLADRGRPFSVIRLPHRSLPGLAAYPFSLYTPRAIASARPDVIHAHCFYYASIDGAFLAAQLTRTPLVLSPSIPLRTGRRWLIYRRVMRPLFRRAAVTTVLSRYELTLLRRSGFAPRHTVVVPPAVLPPRVPPTTEVSLPWDPAAHRILLFVGRISDAKGVDTLIAALPTVIRSAPDARLVLVGPLGAQSFTRYHAQIRSLGLTAHVWFAGDVPPPTLAWLYGHSTAFVFPSRYEAFGIVVLEAMASGLPPVVSDAAALPEVVGDGARGIIHKAGDPRSLARAVLTLLTDRELYSALAQAGRTYAHAHTPEAHGSRLEEIYDHALKRPRHDDRKRW